MNPKNFRDVGDMLGLWLQHSPIESGRLLRGGALDRFTRWEDIGSPKTIVNLRKGPDENLFSAVRYLHLPADDRVENYDTSSHRVRRWTRAVIAALASPNTLYPVYLHCTSGRDRTGVVIATLLRVLNVDPEVIAGEYMLSDGAKIEYINTVFSGLDHDYLLDLGIYKLGLGQNLGRPASIRPQTTT